MLGGGYRKETFFKCWGVVTEKKMPYYYLHILTWPLGPSISLEVE